ncbi:MAG: DoxX family protein [Bryobacteraceae bacterium]
MNDSMASSFPESQGNEGVGPFDLPRWKSVAGWVAAVLTCVLFLVAGLWKITDPEGAAVRLAQAKVPQDLSLIAAIGLGIVETFAAVLILVPRFRRWGSYLASAMLIAFMIYIGIYYDVLRGEECQCFPWIKRAVGPGFFIGDAIMLLFAVIAGLWAKPSASLRSAVLVLGAVTVFALVSYGVQTTRRSGVKAPPTIQVDGKTFPLESGKIFIYFFDPECMHCLDAARRMAKLNWGDTKVIGVAVAQPQFGAGFLQTTGLKAGLSPDAELLKKTFHYESTPAAVAIENGRQKQMLTHFEGDEPAATLKKLGFVY